GPAGSLRRPARSRQVSGGWWHPRGFLLSAAPAAQSLRLGENPPATLLRLPPLLSTSEARRRPGIDAPPPARLECGHSGFVIGTPAAQVGFVKRWPSRSVDLRPLLFARWAAAEAYRHPEERPQGASRIAEGPVTPEADLLRTAMRPPQADLRTRAHDLLARKLAAVLQPPPESLLAVTGPLEWPGTFFPYQRDGIRALVQSKHLLLGDDMGLGKGGARSTKVLTPTGWTTMGEIQV